MKNLLRVLIAGLLIVLPIVARWAWFNTGTYTPSPSVVPPDYGAITSVELPLSTPAPQVVSTEGHGKTVLIDQTHAYLHYYDLDQLTKQLHRHGAEVELLLPNSGSLADHLKYAAAYVVVEPTLIFTTQDIQAVQKFVAQGGRLLVLTDPGYDNPTASVVVANLLLASFDLTFTNDFLYNQTENEGNYRNVILRRFAAHELTKELTQVVMYAARSVETASGTSLMRGDVQTQSSLTGANGSLTPTALSANGRVLAIGDLTFLIPPYDEVFDNTVWIDHIAAFLTGGTRQHQLADFPYVFDRPVDVVLTQGVQLNADNVPIFGQAQTFFLDNQLPVSIVKEPRADHDVIVLGLFSSGASLAPYVTPFGLTLPDAALDSLNSQPPLYMPDIGPVARQGAGVILYAFTPLQNRLVLLAESPARLSQLLTYLQYAGLKDCLVQNPIGLCRLGDAGPLANQTYTPVASLDPIAVNLSIGQTAMLSVRIQGPAGIKGAAFHLEFDPALVEVVDSNPDQADVQIGGAESPGGTIVVNRVDNAAGTIDYAIDGLDARTTTPVTVAIFTLKGKAAGTTKLDFRGVSSLTEGVMVTDNSGHTVAAEGHGSVILVAEGLPPIASTPSAP